MCLLMKITYGEFSEFIQEKKYIQCRPLAFLALLKKIQCVFNALIIYMTFNPFRDSETETAQANGLKNPFYVAFESCGTILCKVHLLKVQLIGKYCSEARRSDQKKL